MFESELAAGTKNAASSNMSSFNVIGIGEVLWDCLPNGKLLGGAPANFAYAAKQLGDNGFIMSRIGTDRFGKEILDEFEAKGLSPEYLQLDGNYQTGFVRVRLMNGQPSYEIAKNCAWDFLELTDQWVESAKNADAVCFGTLAQRSEVSAGTVSEIVAATEGLRVFDVNLRQNYFCRETLNRSLESADICKLNHEELRVVAKLLKFGSGHPIQIGRRIRQHYDLRMLCVTKGSDGSLLITDNEVSECPGISIRVVDTVGAGDSYTAGLVNGFLRGWKLDKINEFANRVGAFVASENGAMPDYARLRV